MHEDNEAAVRRVLGRNLRTLRQRRGVSLLDVCEALGGDCQCEWLEEIEAGRSAATMADLRGIAAALDARVEGPVDESSNAG